MVIQCKWIFDMFLQGYEGITLFPFIFVYDKKDIILLRHERCHIKQCFQYLIIGFYLIYICEYIVFRLRGLDHNTAYMNIPFEVEARAAEWKSL